MEFLATLAPDPGLFLSWLRLCLRERFPCQRTSLASCIDCQRVAGLGYGTLVWGGPGSVFTSAGQEADSHAVERPAA